MKNQMWSGRFSTESSELLKEFNASLNFDKILYKHDIQGSIAHATMLEKCGIITQSELDSLVAGLKAVQSEIEQGKFSFDIREWRLILNFMSKSRICSCKTCLKSL